MFLPPPQTLILRLRSPLPKTLPRGPRISPAMSVHLHTHAFAGNPLRSKLARPAGPCSPGSAFETLKSLLAAGADEGSSPGLKVLAFRKGRPLARSLEPVSDSPPRWHLGWISPSKFKDSSVDDFVYLGSGSEGDADTVYWAIDVSSSPSGFELGGGGNDGLCFVELRTLMVATDWADTHTMGELAIAGHVCNSHPLHYLLLLISLITKQQIVIFLPSAP